MFGLSDRRGYVLLGPLGFTPIGSPLALFWATVDVFSLDLDFLGHIPESVTTRLLEDFLTRVTGSTMSDELVQTLQDHGPALYKISWRILGNANEVDDVLQDAVLEALEVSQREDVSSWVGLLKRLTVFRSLDRLRKRRADLALDQVEVASTDDSPADRAIGQELRHRLRKTLDRIPRRQAEVFCLRRGATA